MRMKTKRLNDMLQKVGTCTPLKSVTILPDYIKISKQLEQDAKELNEIILKLKEQQLRNLNLKE
jgi:hypothetical protein